MFYFHEILKKRGKFGYIWLAATAPKRLTKRDVISVDVVKSSNDVVDILTQYPTIAGRQNVRFSLYLSSQLMFGLASVNLMKSDILLEDLKNLSGRIGAFRRQVLSTIDLQEPTSGFRVTFDEPDFENAPIDFGSFSIQDASSACEPSYEYFIVSTPKSSEEWQISPGPPDDYRSVAVIDYGEDLMARPEDITMFEESPLQTEEPHAEDIADVIQGADFLEEPLSFLSSHPVTTQSVERDVPEREPELSETAHMEPLIVADSEMPIIDDHQESLDLAPPDVLISAPDEPQDRTTAARNGTDILPPRRPERSPRRSDFDDSKQDDTFLLQPVVTQTGRRRKRKRRLIIDRRIILTQDEIRNNLQSANVHLVRPLEIVSLQESAESMLSRFGSRAAAHGNKRFWRNLRTLPEPNDPSPFGGFTDEEPEVPTDISPEEVPVPDITAEQLHITGSREEPRAEETRDDTRDHSTGASITLLSSSHSRFLQDTRDQSVGPEISKHSKSSLQVPDVTGGDLPERRDIDLIEDTIVESLAVVQPEPLVHEREIEFDVLSEHEEERDLSAARGRQTCIVSPEKTPPPPSPEPPTSPLSEHAMALVTQTFEDNNSASLITFTSVIDKTPKTRKYVAKLFSLLLNLHATSIIYIEQAYPGGEIFISKGPNFYAF